MISQTVALDADMFSPTYWLYWSGGSAYHDTLDSNMVIADCGDSAFNDDDLSCLEEQEYEDEVCLSSNNTLWSGHPHRTFTVHDGLCHNDEVVYKYVLWNDTSPSLLTLPSGQVLDANIEATFYLHYELVYRMVTDNETVGQWWLSRDEIGTKKNRIAFCDEENLMDCTSNKWIVKVTEHGVDGDGEDTLDGTIFNLIDEFTSVRDGSCDIHFGSTDRAFFEDDLSAVEILALVVVAAITLLCFVSVVVGTALCCWRRLKYQQYQHDVSKVEQSLNHAVSPVDDGDETTEISVDLSVFEVEITL